MSKNSHAKHEQKQKHKHKHQPDMSYQKPHEDYHVGAFGDIVIVLLIIGLGLFFVVPFFPYLNNGSLVFVLVVFLLIILLFGLFVWRKKKR